MILLYYHNHLNPNSLRYIIIRLNFVIIIIIIFVITMILISCHDLFNRWVLSSACASMKYYQPEGVLELPLHGLDVGVLNQEGGAQLNQKNNVSMSLSWT